jgi:hypothetical protein
VVADALQLILDHDVVADGRAIAAALRNAHGGELVALQLLSRVDPRPDGAWLPS